MSGLAYVSASALSEAARGQRWPSWQVVAGYVTACGEDPDEWRARWEALRPPTDKTPVVTDRPTAVVAGSVGPEPELHSELEPTPHPDADSEPDPRPASEPVDPPSRTPTPVPARRRGRSAAVGAGIAVILAVAAVIAATRPATSAPLPRQSTAATATATAQVPVLRHGTLAMVPGQVADLDSTAGDWDEQPEPGPQTADVWFGAQDHALHGVGDNDIAVLPPGSAGGFWPCALEQDYGVTLAAPDVRPGRVLCGLTAANRVAQLRITNVTYDSATGEPDAVVFDVTVWVPKHKT